MTQKTLNKIHKEYLASLMCSKDILSITKNLYERLSILNISEEDQAQFDLFLKGVRDCISYRERTNNLTSLMQGIVTTFVHIFNFMNHCKGKNWDVDIGARRKALEKDLSKMLYNAIEGDSPLIRDRFGARIVLLNDKEFLEDELFAELHDISNSIQAILCGTNRKLRNEFCEFVSDLKDPFIKPQIDTVMSLPFSLVILKDFIAESKEKNGYQSIHLCFRIEFTSDYFAGAEMEFQIRSLTMDEKAESGEYNHFDYDKKYEKVKKIFHIPDDEMFKSLDIYGFSSYKSSFDDRDGIGSAKRFLTRRVSRDLIPKHKNE